MGTRALITGRRRAQLEQELALAQSMTAEHLRRVPASPMYQSIGAQLDAIASDLATGNAPTPEIQDRIMFGVYAAREIEDVDPEYADVLHKVSYVYKHDGTLGR